MIGYYVLSVWSINIFLLHYKSMSCFHACVLISHGVAIFDMFQFTPVLIRRPVSPIAITDLSIAIMSSDCSDCSDCSGWRN